MIVSNHIIMMQDIACQLGFLLKHIHKAIKFCIEFYENVTDIENLIDFPNEAV